MRIAVPDLISNSYFPVIAARELGFFAAEGLDVAVELIFPVNKAYEALREGSIAFVGGSAHSALAAFPDWRGARLLCAQAQGMYWFLVMRSDLGARRGDLDCVKGRRIGAAPWVDMGLKQLLIDAGYDLQRDGIRIAPVPGSLNAGTNFGINAARALEEGKIDGFWANGMGTEVAVRRGVGTVVLDVRRGDGPPGCFAYTFSALATSDEIMRAQPDAAAAAVRAIASTLAALKRNPDLATDAARGVFPPDETALIAELIRRDLPYYDPSIPETAVAGMNRFARDVGLIGADVEYAQIVATQFAPLWQS